MITRIALMFALILAAAVAVNAEAPKTISYQGRITDAVGVPVPDGPQSVTFRIFNAPVAGALLWNEPGVAVNTESGLFTTTLGSPTAFPTAWFPDGSEKIFAEDQELWLELEVNGDVQTPRVQLQSVPFAIVASNLSGRGENDPDVGIRTYSDFAQLSTFGYDGEEKARIWGPGWGELILSDAGQFLGSTSDVTAYLSAGDASGGYLELSDGSGALTMGLYGGTNGDGAAQLPNDAINSSEMLNEPGIAASKYVGNGLALVMSEASSTNIVSVTITIPAPGYIVLDGIMYTVNNNASSSFSWAQITETPGAPWLFGRSVWANSTGYANGAGTYTYVNTPVKATFFKPAAGKYTFLLQGNVYSGNTGGTTVYALSPSWIQATYFPTSYGTVMSVAEKPPTDNPEYMEESGRDPMTNSPTTEYTQDLRYYELEAAKAHARDMEAQAALAKAKAEAAVKLQAQKKVGGSNTDLER